MINFAYVDPGLGQMAWQVLVATFLGTFFYIKKLRVWFEGLIRRGFRALRSRRGVPAEQPQSGTLAQRPLRSGGLAVGMFGLVLAASIAVLGVGKLKAQAKAIATDTLPGLSLAGAANASSSQAFNRALLLIMGDDPAQAGQLRQEMQSFSEQTTSSLEAYKHQIFSPEELANYQDLVQRRAEYFRVREQTIALLAQKGKQEAAGFVRTGLLPAYWEYKAACDKLFDYNVRQGKNQGQSFLTFCTTTQVLACVVAVVIFMMGLLIGRSGRVSFSPNMAVAAPAR